MVNPVGAEPVVAPSSVAQRGGDEILVGGSVEGKLVWQKRRPNLEWTKSGVKKMHSTWHQKWVPDLVPRSGYQIWRPEVGTRFGAKKWVPNLALNMEYNLEQRGDQKWVPDLVPRSGYQIWPPEVGTKFGPQK